MARQSDDSSVFQAVVDLIADHGYQGTTTKAIATRAGINEVTLFRRYGNKKDLAVAAIKYWALRFEPDDHTPTGDLAADLHRIATVFRQGSRNHDRLFIVMLTEGHDEPDLRAAMAGPGAVVRSLCSLIASYQDRGELDAGEPIHLLAALLGPLFTISLLLSLDSQPPVTEPDLDDLVSRFLRAYGTTRHQG